MRAAWDRRVEGPEEHLWAAVEGAAVLDQGTLEVTGREQLPARQATVTVRATTVALQPPRSRSQAAPAVPLSAVLVREEAPPEGVEPLERLLLTTLPVTTAAEAWRCVQRGAPGDTSIVDITMGWVRSPPVALKRHRQGL
ncbi:MAG: hypothetical protein IT204_26065 [Fimbriimonadaceae bacterium]|nr:hypothetical protein [Fimbriimonadaceae bacterium]